MAEDARWMARAVALAANGWPAPGVHVGCVIVKGGKPIGEGWHEAPGRPHAEAMALAAAGPKAKRATVYVTLEPCTHTGKTPPCADALIRAEVARVVVAVRDPHVIASGGIEKLRAAGIRVELYPHPGAERVARRFLHAHRTGRAHLTVKAAITMDGRTARADGSSKWITSESAREDARRLRAECGAVMVGYRTVLADDPGLDARIEGLPNPVTKVVIDPHGRLTGRERLFGTPGETIVLRDELGPDAVLKTLFERGLTGVLLEGGAATISRFLPVAREVVLYVAPKTFGDGPVWFAGGWESEDWTWDPPAAIGPDLKLTGRR